MILGKKEASQFGLVNVKKIRDKVTYSQSWLNAIWVETEEWKQ